MATYKTAIAGVFKALRAKLTRTGVNIGSTAAYPRVEIHSVVEDAPADKGGSLRSITCTIECMSVEKVADIVTLAADNTDRIFDGAGLSMDDYYVVGIVAGQTRMFSEQETSDSNKVLYRILQDITIWVDKK